MVKSYNDPIKQLAREKLRDFIKKNLLSIRSPKDLKVLCFPGAERDGEEAVEIKEVYDPLGIPRKNITGLECDVVKSERLRKANLGIEVIRSTDYSFLESARKQQRAFDVVSLDYTSFINQNSIYSLDLISGDALLGNFGVLATNFMGARENESSKNILIMNSTPVSSKPIEELLCDYENAITRSFKDMPSFEKISNFKLQSDRESTIRNLIVSTFLRGSATLHIAPYEFIHSFKHFKSSLESLAITSEDPTLIMDLKDISGRSTLEQFMRMKAMRLFVDATFWKYFEKVDIDPEVLSIFWYTQVKPYFLENHESYSYTSNSKTPMLFDLFYFNKNERDLRKFSDMLSFDGSSGIITMPESVGSTHKKVKLLSEAVLLSSSLSKKSEQLVELLKSERQYLGNSYKTPHRINKRNALELLMDGCSPKEIHEAYPGTKVHKLAAWKAHMTMGTYQKKVA